MNRIPLRTKVIRPPPPTCDLFCISVVYLGSLVLWCGGVSLVSCISDASMLSF